MTTAGRARLRADAERNRDAIVAAARQVFGAVGLEASLDEIAQTAGVGNATLYRRFPNRAQLIAEVFADRLRGHITAIHVALTEPDPWAGFSAYVEEAFDMQARDRGLADLITMRIRTVPELEALQAEAYAGFVELVRRAKAAGTLRTDFQPEDLLIFLMANAGLLERAHSASASASARLAHIMLDGLRAASATPGPPPPTRQRLARAMIRNADATICHMANDRC